MSDMPERLLAWPSGHNYQRVSLAGGRPNDAVEYVRANAIPAAQTTVKPGEIERAVWGAMGWALRHAKQMPGDIIPAYTDTGNSDAEVECRRSAARILSALDMQPTVSPDVAALVEAVDAAFACRMIPKSSVSEGGANKYSEQVRVADQLRAALARVKGVM